MDHAERRKAVGWVTGINTLWVCLCLVILAGCRPGPTHWNAPFATAIGGMAPSPAVPGATPAAGNLASSTGVEPGANLKFRRLSVAEGLSQSTVTCTLQDSIGYIWIGTQDGLNRYDGVRMQVFKHDAADPDSLSDNIILDLFEDHDGQLWVGTADGLNRYDRNTGKFVHYLHNPDNYRSLLNNTVHRIIQTSEGYLWFGTDRGLDRYDQRNNQFTHYQRSQTDANSLSGSTVNDILEDSQGALWIATSNGLDMLNRDNGRITHYRHELGNPNTLSYNNVSALYEDHRGRLWIGTSGGGLDILDETRSQFSHYQFDPMVPTSLNDNSVTTIYEDHLGTLWIGTNRGLNQYQPVRGSFYRYSYQPDDPESPASLSAPEVLSIYQDRSGSYWVGTNGGGLNLFDYTSERFFHFRQVSGDANSLSNNNVRTLYEDLGGVLWVGTNNGLNKYNSRTGTFAKYYLDPSRVSLPGSNLISAVYQDGNGALWVGSNQGLFQFDWESDRLVPYDVPVIGTGGLNTRLTSAAAIRAIIQTPDRHYWLATDGTGLFELNDQLKQAVAYTHDPSTPASLGSNTVTSLLVDREQRLWVGTLFGGLDRYDPTSQEFIHYLNDPNDPNSLSDNNVLSLHQDSSGALWVGTMGGLNRLDPVTGEFKAYLVKDGLPNDVVYAILEDDQGRLWLSTNRGIARFDYASGQIKNFSISDGLQSNEFNPGAAFRSKAGVIYFGGINGFNRFDPQKIVDNAYVPPVVLTSLTQGGQKIELEYALETTREVTLNWPSNYFEFSFTALSYIQPEKNQFSYRLEPYDKDWIKAASRPGGEYTNLPGGVYLLHIRGSNNDGAWNEGIPLRIRVVPPFWESTWFQGGAVLLLLALLGSGYWLRVRAVESNNRLLAAQVEARTREIQQRRKVAEGLGDVLLLLNSNRPLQESLELIVNQVQVLFHAQRVGLFSIQPGKLEVLVACCPQGGLPELSEDVLAWLTSLISDDSPHTVRNLSGWRCEHPRQKTPWLEGVRSVMCAPVHTGGGLFGGLAVLLDHEVGSNQEDLDLLTTFSDQVALALGNASLRERAEEMAVVSERNRLARDLHDAVTQTLFSASLIAESLPSIWEKEPEEGRQLLNDLRQLNRGALAEMRTLLMELRPSAVADARLPDLLQQLGEAVSSRTGMNVILDLCSQCDLPRDVHVGVYRIAQEALANVVKHARASQLTLRLTNEIIRTEDGEMMHVLLEIWDNGIGFDLTRVPPDHFGLTNLHDRAQSMGANLEVISQPGEGTRIRMQWQGRATSNE